LVLVAKRNASFIAAAQLRKQPFELGAESASIGAKRAKLGVWLGAAIKIGRPNPTALISALREIFMPCLFAFNAL
jgi:hypothetical protein